MKTTQELSTRQWNLHQYLKSQIDWVSLKTICLDLGYATPENYKVNCGGYRVLVTDIKKLKLCDVIKRVPLTHTRLGVKYARTNKEADEFIKNLRTKGKEKLYMASILEKKIALDGQKVLQFTGHEKDFIESLVTF